MTNNRTIEKMACTLEIYFASDDFVSVWINKQRPDRDSTTTFQLNHGPAAGGNEVDVPYSGSLCGENGCMAIPIVRRCCNGERF